MSWVIMRWSFLHQWVFLIILHHWVFRPARAYVTQNNGKSLKSPNGKTAASA